MLLQPVIDHHRFERLANAPVILHERENQQRQSKLSDSPDQNPYSRLLRDASPPTPTEVNKDGIRKFNWVGNGDWNVDWIETKNGETLRSTDAPARWTYWAIPLFPILGFFIPWGTVRAIGWVLAGFVQPSR